MKFWLILNLAKLQISLNDGEHVAQRPLILPSLFWIAISLWSSLYFMFYVTIFIQCPKIEQFPDFILRFFTFKTSPIPLNDSENVAQRGSLPMRSPCDCNILPEQPRADLSLPLHSDFAQNPNSIFFFTLSNPHTNFRFLLSLIPTFLLLSMILALSLLISKSLGSLSNEWYCI